MVATQLSTNTLRGVCMYCVSDACMLTTSVRAYLPEVLSDFQSTRTKLTKSGVLKILISYSVVCCFYNPPVMSCREKNSCSSASSLSLQAIQAGCRGLLLTLSFLKIKLSSAAAPASVQDSNDCQNCIPCTSVKYGTEQTQQLYVGTILSHSNSFSANLHTATILTFTVSHSNC